MYSVFIVTRIIGMKALLMRLRDAVSPYIQSRLDIVVSSIQARHLMLWGRTPNEKSILLHCGYQVIRKDMILADSNMGGKAHKSEMRNKRGPSPVRLQWAFPTKRREI